jgi:hypothetical protein
VLDPSFDTTTTVAGSPMHELYATALNGRSQRAVYDA